MIKRSNPFTLSKSTFETHREIMLPNLAQPSTGRRHRQKFSNQDVSLIFRPVNLSRTGRDNCVLGAIYPQRVTASSNLDCVTSTFELAVNRYGAIADESIGF